jgi:8-oxo-dGTP diphosphatase
MRAVFYERADASAAADALHAQGYAAWLRKERFAGEDDELDHPWAIETDAPDEVVAGLVDDDTGWLERG